MVRSEHSRGYVPSAEEEGQGERGIVEVTAWGHVIQHSLFIDPKVKGKAMLLKPKQGMRRKSVNKERQAKIEEPLERVFVIRKKTIRNLWPTKDHVTVGKVHRSITKCQCYVVIRSKKPWHDISTLLQSLVKA